MENTASHEYTSQMDYSNKDFSVKFNKGKKHSFGFYILIVLGVFAFLNIVLISLLFFR